MATLSDDQQQQQQQEEIMPSNFITTSDLHWKNWTEIETGTETETETESGTETDTETETGTGTARCHLPRETFAFMTHHGATK